MLWNRYVCCLATLIVCGCTQMPDKTLVFTPQPPQQRQLALKRLTTFQCWGTLSLIAKGRKPLFLSVHWVQNGRDWVATLSSLFGFASVTLRQTGQQACLQKGRAKPICAPSAEQLLAQQTGWQLPLAQWPNWLKAASSAPLQARYDAYGHLIGLQQSPWQLQWQQFLSYGPIDLPTQIVATTPTLKLHIALRQWQH